MSWFQQVARAIRLRQALQSAIASIGERFLTFSMYTGIIFVNLAEARAEFRKSFDHYIPHDTTDRRPWSSRSTEDDETGDLRAIGTVTIPYKASIGLDLRRVRVQIDPANRIVHFALPEVQITGVQQDGAACEGDHRVELEFQKPLLQRRGQWVLRDKSDQSFVWADEQKTAFNSVLACRQLDDRIQHAVAAEAERRVASIVQLATGFRAIATSRAELDAPVLLQDMCENVLSAEDISRGSASRGTNSNPPPLDSPVVT